MDIAQQQYYGWYGCDEIMSSVCIIAFFFFSFLSSSTSFSKSSRTSPAQIIQVMHKMDPRQQDPSRGPCSLPGGFKFTGKRICGDQPGHDQPVNKDKMKTRLKESRMMKAFSSSCLFFFFFFLAGAVLVSVLSRLVPCLSGGDIKHCTRKPHHKHQIQRALLQDMRNQGMNASNSWTQLITSDWCIVLSSCTHTHISEFTLYAFPFYIQ